MKLKFAKTSTVLWSWLIGLLVGRVSKWKNFFKSNFAELTFFFPLSRSTRPTKHENFCSLNFAHWKINSCFSPQLDSPYRVA